VHVYTGGNLVSFVRSMSRCRVAISMKLHSSAIWAAVRSVQYPMTYAPKGSSFFGLPWNGLAIHRSPAVPSVRRNEAAAAGVVASAIERLPLPSYGRRMRSIDRYAFQLVGFLVDVWRKITTRFVGHGRAIIAVGEAAESAPASSSDAR
jgi:hypothetical protein